MLALAVHAPEWYTGPQADDEGEMKTPRDDAYKAWLAERGGQCQVPGCGRMGQQVAHPPKRYPYGGGMSLKASDYGCVWICFKHHTDEHSSNVGFFRVWGSELDRANAVIANLQDYIGVQVT